MKILLKLSGEALSGNKWFGFDENMLKNVSDIVRELIEKWHKVWIVVWAWNFIRWAEIQNIDRTIADNMWMLAININALALYDYFTKNNIKCKNLNSFAIDGVAERFNKPKAIEFMEEFGVIIFWWGTWNPYFTTDTAGVLRALEIEADLMIKATKVDGLYTKDPQTSADAEFIQEIGYDEVIKKWYKVMDLTAITLAKANGLKIKIVNLQKKWAILRAVETDTEWSLVQ